MSSEEKRTWIELVLSIGTYIAYVTIVLGRADGGALTEVAYVPILLWAIGISIVAAIVVNIAVAIMSPKDAGKTDRRDTEISRFGIFAGSWVLVAGALAALWMSMLEFDHFWIANVIYLGFVLSAAFGAIMKIVAYRRGLSTW